ncbi:site-specific recombinase XerD [Schinkia azotoformans MEV2011]|uniref:Site-specific recombinase XerD n=1 Tax=Schinkia azotoformans MEV2011 TaxID=1348973 RepID=A0A072NXV0_SCHAZ|nr:tyrosine-type recombinase/integrase [Schinkia azotoformans]KEF38055.1 site-specific recombinase XerD [Schinkia azotoformans MEV2011]MEC1695778.1 tyrosine-type recombinase/integrase [Schinkia azotoformans]MEC1725111.1 tyrosine-type recombinase/integrase [Schinkia azotoformans]MEC1769771.1 tyrosine-type recombinase/integrase [Schinkia azotoformans]MEC1779311.1 tyrosine-type recombinase/integrase [Schinkia azotoformans]
MKSNMKESNEIANHINKFIRVYCPSSKTSSEHTIKSYQLALTLFMDFLEEKKKISINQLSYDCFKAETIDEWLIWLMNERNCKPQSANVRLSSIKAFLKYLSTQDITLSYLSIAAALVKKRRAPKIKVKGMSKEGVKALLGTIDQSTKTGRRDLAMFILLYDIAARIDEILSLKIKNVRLNVPKPNVTITGKGNKHRSLGLNSKTVQYLEKFVSEYHGMKPNEDDFLFYSKIKGKKKKLTQPAVTKQLKKWAAIANQVCPEVPVTLHPHQIRHAAATHWMENGMNVGEIQYLLGHENIQTTMVYLEITVTQEASAMKQLMTEEEANQPKLWKEDIRKLRDLCK